MSPLQHGLAIVAALATLGIVIEMLRRRQLRERHAMWWLVAGISALLISIFPQILDWIAGIFGFEIPINLVFFSSLFILFLVGLQHSSELTKLESHNRALVERVVLLELKLEELTKNKRDD